MSCQRVRIENALGFGITISLPASVTTTTYKLPFGSTFISYLALAQGNNNQINYQSIIRTLTGTTNQIVVSNPTGEVTLSLASNLKVGTGGYTSNNGTPALEIRNCTLAPSTNPTNGGVLYVQAGALKYRGSAGTVTVIKPA